jgi:nitroreductase
MVRRFEPRPVPRETLDRVLEAALHAPSAGFTQGNELLVLDRPETTTRFWDLTTDPEWERRYRAMVEGATPPAIVVPLTNRRAYLDRYSEDDKAGRGLREEDAWAVPYWDVDGGMAAMAMLLAAVDEGLGAWFFGISHGERALLEAFDVPAGFRPIGAIGLGYASPGAGPKGSAATRRRRPLDELIHRNTW